MADPSKDRPLAWMIAIAILAMLVVTAAFLARKSQLGTPGPVVGIPPKIVTHPTSERSWVVSKRDRDAYLENLADAVRHVTLKPEPGEKENSVSRISIIHLEDASPLHRAGFRVQDQIVTLNGSPIVTMQRALNLVHEVQEATCVTVQIRRGEQLLDYRFDFQ